MFADEILIIKQDIFLHLMKISQYTYNRDKGTKNPDAWESM